MVILCQLKIVYVHLGTPNENCRCDVTINVFDKRHECPGAFSILECLYDNPRQNGGKVYNSGIDVTEDLNRVILPPIIDDIEIPPAIDNEGYIQDGRAIDSGEVMLLLQRFARPCGEGVNDYYQGVDEPGCLPYSGSLFSNNVTDTTCNDGSIINNSCCSDLKCDETKTQDCNPCFGVVDDAPINDEVWKEDLCYYYCPSYWTQRQFLQENGFFTDDEQLCSDKYKTLCDLMGCEPDNACKIKWGGCNYQQIDRDICRGGVWESPFLENYTPQDRCNNQPPSAYCTNKGICSIQNVGIPCENDPWDTPGILPTVIRKN